MESYHVILGDERIEAGEMRNYTAISAAFAGMEEIEGYYPGLLTIELTGRVVVEAGGSLGIGTLSLGGPELSPVLTGTGQIVVEAGGSLRLTDVLLEPEGDGPIVVQEPGGSVEFQLTEAAEGQVEWSTPLVNNLYDSPEDLWLEEGTALTEKLLPAALWTQLQVCGSEEESEISLAWDMGGYDGKTQGELTLTGCFLDESGLALPSLYPLELTVHWYTAENLAVTSAVWKGDLTPSVQLTVEQLPEFADVWGEVSTDGGESWERWEDESVFFIVPVEREGTACVFVLPDDTPRWFRIAAEDPWEHLHWNSDWYYLYPEEQEDSGGNRGGSTTPDTPEREPVPLPAISPEPEQPPLQKEQLPLPVEQPSLPAASEPPEVSPPPPEPEAASTPEQPRPRPLKGQGTAVSTPAEPEQTPVPTLPTQIPQPSAVSVPSPASEKEPAQSAVPAPAGEQRPAGSLSGRAQGLLVAGGFALCAGAAAAAAGIFRKKR